MATDGIRVQKEPKKGPKRTKNGEILFLPQKLFDKIKFEPAPKFGINPTIISESSKNDLKRAEKDQKRT